ncbi:hypothetical protein EYZ11_008437 [Aspergillus tanneri]|uniref:Uncharacterized protein n=1 Tax=Aspergillus tanneri TaxID=1220188 RepID=A0A4V3UNQ1_9EURO|nr:hypothetical protein EYZ11_008437 [Aspergillus tanneri]
MTSQPENSHTSTPLESSAYLEPVNVNQRMILAAPIIISSSIWTNDLSFLPSSGGYIRSVESFEPKVDFTIKAGHEWFCVDADKKFGRLSISAIAADTEGQAEVITDVNRMRVETVHEPYKPLEGMMFASSQHFVNDEKMGNMIAELRLSRFIPDSGYQQHTLKSRKILEQWLLPSRRLEIKQNG